MFARCQNPDPQRHRRAIVVCLAAAFGTGAAITSTLVGAYPQRLEASHGVGALEGQGEQPQTVLLVQNCDDAGPNSLRDAIDLANALSGDVTIEFDMNSMQCSSITLTSGEIMITRDNLALQGPSADLLTIDGGADQGHFNRILHHTGVGTLTITGLTLADAEYVTNGPQVSSGGCVYGYSVSIYETRVHNCHSHAIGSAANGGGVAARSSLNIVASSISNCDAISEAYNAFGGGAFAAGQNFGTFSTKYSVFENNAAHSFGQAYLGRGGGVALLGVNGAVLAASTISGNEAESAGGVYAKYDITVADSTIYGNEAVKYGALDVAHAGASVYSSTIVANGSTAAGVVAGLHAQTVKSNSAIFAFNVTDDGMSAIEADVGSADGIVSGANNLIMNTAATAPSDTSSACPRLAPLWTNGGPTRTLALLPASPAIDGGNHVDNLGTDQRGMGFVRVVGGAADMGAYEWAAGSGEFINRAGFESCE